MLLYFELLFYQKIPSKIKAVAQKLYTTKEYFAFCKKNEGLYQFVNEEISEMARETITSNLIARKIHFFLGHF
ncbi:MAG: hypothetical protein EAZ70_01305 [Runella slithyformis]|nr:MAG: hypothetical protein EAY79_01660 [Runella slithyformis]TAF29568.1 MAG: hypothetical protein EAZ70_01305 [Runella slithyformis]TAF48402.1 MAG: hypothetical protein EAZ63_04760 [Runella slithyformis]TAF83039.1 MAG: hypothetical protein EAZ50_02705 [Runella slithyformis]